MQNYKSDFHDKCFPDEAFLVTRPLHGKPCLDQDVTLKDIDTTDAVLDSGTRKPFSVLDNIAASPSMSVQCVQKNKINRTSSKLNISSKGNCVLIDKEDSALYNYEEESNSFRSLVNEGGDNPRLSNYVYQILDSSGEGRFQIQAYDYECIPKNKVKLLQNKRRTYFSKHTITKLVIFHEIHRTSSYDISSDRLNFLAKSVAELFPKLLVDNLYAASSKDSSSSTGIFSFFLRKLREKALAIEALKTIRSLKRKFVEELPYDLTELQLPVHIIDKRYIEKWSSVSKEDKKHFFVASDIEKIFTTFPNLCRSSGYLLIEADFCNFFDKEHDLFQQNWPEVAAKIIALSQSKSNDKEVKNILKENAMCIKNGHQNVLALILLPYMFKKITKQTTRSKSGKSWNPEKAEVLHAFVYHIKVTENLEDALNEAQQYVYNLHTQHKLCIGPYVIITGSTLDSITSAYVIIPGGPGGLKYELHSPIFAVDLCFKIVKTFHKSFSNISKHIWQFIERELYDFPLKNCSSSVGTLIEKLNDM